MEWELVRSLHFVISFGSLTLGRGSGSDLWTGLSSADCCGNGYQNHSTSGCESDGWRNVQSVPLWFTVVGLWSGFLLVLTWVLMGWGDSLSTGRSFRSCTAFFFFGNFWYRETFREKTSGLTLSRIGLWGAQELIIQGHQVWGCDALRSLLLTASIHWEGEQCEILLPARSSQHGNNWVSG